MSEAYKRGLGDAPGDKPQLEIVTFDVTVNGKPERLTVDAVNRYLELKTGLRN